MAAIQTHICGAPQQAVKGAQIVSESPARRIRRFTTEQPEACRFRKARGEKQSGID
jgi:hypothetical protein